METLTNEQLTKMVADQNEQIEGLKKLLTAKTEIKVEEVKKITIPEKAVKRGRKEYKWLVPHFNLNGKVITAEDAATDDKILEQILAMEGQGILKEQA